MDTDKKQIRRLTIIKLSIELFFAILPLFVLGFVWPASGETHPKTFFTGPEWSMTSCILYGLALARLQEAVPTHLRGTNHNHAMGMSAVSLIPLTGVIISVLLIGKLSHGTNSLLLIAIQIANLVGAIILFAVIGGYGIFKSLSASPVE